MVVQQVDHMISVCMSEGGRFRRRGRQGGMREEEEEKKEEGYREWLQAATSARDSFFLQSGERWRLFFSSGGEVEEEKLSAETFG